MTIRDHFPHYTFGGDPRSRGLAYGAALAERIHATFAFYNKRLFARNRLPEAELIDRAERMRGVIESFDRDFVDELDAVAEAASAPRWQIYLLNARTEILNADVNECTSLCFPRSRLLGQTWDWFEGFEELAVLVTYERADGTRLLTFTEPGMLAKIGVNDRGVGVCLNFLDHVHTLDGLPIHVLIRAILDCGSVDAARKTIERAGFGKSSHLLVADGSGDALSVEFLGSRTAELAARDGDYLHTNHCIDPNEPGRLADDGSSTFRRFARGADLLTRHRERSFDVLQSILVDQHDGEFAINNPFHDSASFPGETIGSCGTFLIDLVRRQMHVKKGPGTHNPFKRYRLEGPASAAA